MIKITLTYTGNDSAKAISNSNALSLYVNEILVYSQEASSFQTAQTFLESLNQVADFEASLNESFEFQVSGLLSGTWDLSTPAEIVLYPQSILSSHALMTWEQAKILINATEDERLHLETLINSVSLVAERDYAKRPLKKRSFTQIVDGPGSRMLELLTYPVESVQCWLDSTRTFGPETEEVVLIYKDIGIVKRAVRLFPEGLQNIKLEYIAGYDPIPEDLVTACAESVAYMRARLQQNGSGIRSMSAPNGITTTYELTFPMNAQRIFESYRK